jgi:DNA-binding transcriptional MerR regulator
MLTRVGDVARILGVAEHVVRYWSDEFSIKPERRPGGQRVYSPANIDRLREVHRLLKVEKMTMKGAKRLLKGDSVEPTGDGKILYCPHCGTTKAVAKAVSYCKSCGKRVTWIGPLWGQA